MSSSRVEATQTVATNLKVDASGVAVPVTDNGGSLTVDGAVTVSGTATVSGTVTANAGTGTLAVSAAALPLPTGASTAAKQPALGTAGTASADVITVQGVASMTAVKVDGSAVTQPVSGTVTASGPLTDTQLRATAVPVSGTVTANAGTGTLAVSAASLPLPAGASTAAKQPALGTAGTASADVITVQGVASGVPLFSGLRQINISQTPTVSTSPAYTAADALGGLLTFANAARTSAGSGIVQAVTIMCKTPALVPAIDLVLFNQTFTAVADNAAFNPSDADMANCIGYIPLTAWSDFSLNSMAVRFGLGFPFTLTGTSLFGQMVIRSAVTMTGTTDVIVGLQILYTD